MHFFADVKEHSTMYSVQCTMYNSVHRKAGCKILCGKGLTLIFISRAGGLGGAAPQKLLGIQFC